MSKDEYKKTAVKLSKRSYDDLHDLSVLYGLSHNALMVLAINKFIDFEKRNRAYSDQSIKENTNVI